MWLGQSSEDDEQSLNRLSYQIIDQSTIIFLQKVEPLALETIQKSELSPAIYFKTLQQQSWY